MTAPLVVPGDLRALGVTPRSVAIAVATFLLLAAGLYRVFGKLGIRRWKAVVPFYGTYVTMGEVGVPRWLAVGLPFPVANTLVSLLVYYRLARRFGCGKGVSVLVGLLPFVGVPWLGLSDREVGSDERPGTEDRVPDRRIPPGASLEESPVAHGMNAAHAVSILHGVRSSWTGPIRPIGPT